MGLRVTDEKVIKVVEDVMIEFNKEIVSASDNINVPGLETHFDPC